MSVKKKVLVNIGHGNTKGIYDSGAVSPNGEHEHVLNRDLFAPLLKKELESLGFEVITIIQEKSFGELPRRINLLKPDVIISLHLNSYSTSSSGTETLFWSKSTRSKRLAELVQTKMVSILGLPNRGIKGLTTGRGVALLRDTNSPCVILEPAFISNPKDLAVWKSKVSELSKGIALGVSEWFLGL